MKPLSELPQSGTWLSPKQAEAFLPYGINWLEKARKNGKGPNYFNVGRNVFYTPESIAEWTEHKAKQGGLSE